MGYVGLDTNILYVCMYVCMYDMKTRESDEVYLFRAFLEHDQTHGASVAYPFSNSWANGRVPFLFTIVALILQMVI